MRTSRPYANGAAAEPPRAGSPEHLAVVVGAVREDIRQTLRTGWVDPVLDQCGEIPAFLTAAWSAVRPNVGRTFLGLARAIRADAAAASRELVDPDATFVRIRSTLGEEELARVGDVARAAFVAAPKVQIVVHALHRAVRRERVPGTGREESPVRRGVPEWQRWMTLVPAPADCAEVLEAARASLGAPHVPASLRLLARWPDALAVVCDAVGHGTGSPAWRPAAARLRRLVLAGVETLPHAVELQWAALRAKGLTEHTRLRLLDRLAAADASMAAGTMASALAWAAVGAPDLGVE